MSNRISKFLEKHPFIDTYIDHLLKLSIILSILGISILPIILAFWARSVWLLLLYIFIAPLVTTFFSEDW